MDGRKRQLRKRSSRNNKVSRHHLRMMKRGNHQRRNISNHKKKRRKERYSLRIEEVITRRKRVYLKMSTRWIRKRKGNRMPCLMRAEKLRCSSKLWRTGNSLSVIHHSRCIRSRIKSSSALNTLRQC